jgi:TPR repeat protein
LNSDEYVVKSSVSSDVFGGLLKPAHGELITITKDNCASLSLLSEEFGFRSLKSECNTFTQLNGFESRLSSVEERISELRNSFDADQQYRRSQELIYGDHGFEKSRSLALSLLKSSADQDHTDSCYIYGKHLSEGDICERNYAESAKYVQMSADTGNSFGEAACGHFLVDGKGVEQSIEQGLESLRRSAKECNSSGQSLLGHILYHGNGVEKDIDE